MGESVSKSSYKTGKLEAYQLDKDNALPKEKLKSLTERLYGPLQLSCMDSIVTKFIMSERADNCSCVAITCQVSLEHSYLVDYKGNTAL